MTLHDLKCWPKFYNEIAMGRKTVEVRNNDRGFKTGDVLTLREWDPNVRVYTGDRLVCKVVEVWPLDAIGLLGFVAMRIGDVRT